MNDNYKLIEKRYVADVEGYVYLFEHIKSGAHVVKIANKDSNKTFCISFKTQPDDDSGIPHILEHSVLNGSKKYPVKSPFDQLVKCSLNTYLNAMTGNDVTMYPVASVSTKDYFNLMDVYLDAVLNPRIYEDKRILKQEGWRIVAMDPDDDFKYTGVVYNEMKGYYSDPIRELDTIISKTLFPDNCYGCASGGYPAAIPTLTQEHFTQFHSKYYHPENCYVFFYGDADMEQELSKLNDEYLTNYSRSNADYNIPIQAPFTEPKEIKEYYPADDNTDADSETYLSLSFVACRNTDNLHLLALDIIADALVSQESGYIKNAFLQAGIGSEIEAWCDPYQQSVFTFLGYNCSPQKAADFRKVIMDVLKYVAANGLDKETVTAVINRREFYLREGNDAQKGMRHLYEMLTPWIFGANPIDAVESTKIFEKFKQEVENGLLESTIKEFLLDNPHSVMVTLEPKSGLEQEIEANTQQQLNKIKASMTQEQIQALVNENKELDLMQNTPDSPEALKCIPTLSKEDINPKADVFPVEVRRVGDTDAIVYESFTNGITYMRFIFDMKVLPFELLPYGSLLAEVLGLMPTENYTFGELDNIVKTYTGGCGTSNDIYSYVKEGKRVANVELKINGKCLTKNLEKMTDIMYEILCCSKLDDKARLKDLVSRLDSEQDNELNSRAYQIMRNRIESYYNPAAYIDEYMSGIDFFHFVKDLNKNFDAKADELIENLKKTLSLVIRRDNIKCFVQCSADCYAEFERCASKLISKLSGEKSEYHDYNLKPEPKNEGFIAQTKIQYVFKAQDFLSPDFKYSGSASVVGKILSSDYLQNNVRVRGGAYGAFAGLGFDGFVCLSSYRDPNLKSTLDIYDAASEYLSEYSDDEATVFQYIIGTISGKDRPLTTAQKGQVALSLYRIGRGIEDMQRERDEILNTTAYDIRKYAEAFKDFSENGAICVFGSEDIINENSQLFKNIIRL